MSTASGLPPPPIGAIVLLESFRALRPCAAAERADLSVCGSSGITKPSGVIVPSGANTACRGCRR